MSVTESLPYLPASVLTLRESTAKLSRLITLVIAAIWLAREIQKTLTNS
jgi:hypothetical protein